MLIGETVSVALQSIRPMPCAPFSRRWASIIGVAAVITMVALGTGAQKAVEDQIASLGANVRSACAPACRLPGELPPITGSSLTIDDADALERDGQFIEGRGARNRLAAADQSTSTRTSIPTSPAATANFPEVRNYTDRPGEDVYEWR